MRDELLSNPPDALHAHEHDLGPGGLGELRPINAALLLGGILMPGQDGEIGAMIPMRDRDAGIVRPRVEGRHAGHHLESHLCRRQFLCLLAAAAKDVGIAALEPHDRLARLGLGHEQLVELLLWNGMGGGALAAINHLGGLGREPEQLRVHQGVIDQHLGAPDQLSSPTREQPRITRSGTHEINYAF